MSISKEQYAFYCEEGIPYEGKVEGLGQAYQSYSVSVHPINESRTEAMYLVDSVNVCVVAVDTVSSQTGPSAALETKIAADRERIRRDMLAKMDELNKLLAKQSAAHTAELEANERKSAAERAARIAAEEAEKEKVAAEKAAAEKAKAEEAAKEKAEAERKAIRMADALKEIAKEYAKAFVPVSTRVDRSRQIKEIETRLTDLKNQTSDNAIQESLRSTAEQLEKTKSQNKKDRPPMITAADHTDFATRFLQYIGGLRKNFTWGGSNNATPWVNIATKELGVSEEKEKDKHNPRIIEYHHSTTGKFNTDEIPWCSSFVNWVITQSGIKGTNNARAVPWKDWGQPLDNPAYGSIAIIDYGKGSGHVGFVVGKTKSGSIVLLGGNQSDQVKYSPFAAKKIAYYVHPSGYTPNYNIPVISIDSGNTSYKETR